MRPSQRLEPPAHLGWHRPASSALSDPDTNRMGRRRRTALHGTTLDAQLADPALGWSPLMEPGLFLLGGHRGELRMFHHELAHYTLHHEPGTVLWCDGEHGFDPYAFAELNLVRGHQADHGAERMLVKRCMTPFQWDSVLTQHLDQKLLQTEASLVIAAPFDRLYSTDELTDWEQEDYVRFSLRHLRNLARDHRIPILITADMARWWQSHPELASMAHGGVHGRWSLTFPGGRFRAVRDGDGYTVDPQLRRTITLLDFVDDDMDHAHSKETARPRRADGSSYTEPAKVALGRPRPLLERTCMDTHPSARAWPTTHPEPSR